MGLTSYWTISVEMLFDGLVLLGHIEDSSFSDETKTLDCYVADRHQLVLITQFVAIDIHTLDALQANVTCDVGLSVWSIPAI